MTATLEEYRVIDGLTVNFLHGGKKDSMAVMVSWPGMKNEEARSAFAAHLYNTLTGDDGWCQVCGGRGTPGEQLLVRCNMLEPTAFWRLVSDACVAAHQAAIAAN